MSSSHGSSRYEKRETYGHIELGEFLFRYVIIQLYTKRLYTCMLLKGDNLSVSYEP